MGKVIVGVEVGSYTFSVSEKTVTFTGITGLKLENIQMISNVTRGVDLFLFDDNELRGSLSGNVFTLIDADLTGQADADKLQIYLHLSETQFENVKPVYIRDIYDGYYARVDASRRLHITNPPPEVPDTSIKVVETVYAGVSGTVDTLYKIPNGKKLSLQKFTAGGESSNTGGVVELWYDPNGNGVGMSIIEAIFFNGDNDSKDLADEYIGNATNYIRMRAVNLRGGNVDIFRRWYGFRDV